MSSSSSSDSSDDEDDGGFNMGDNGVNINVTTNGTTTDFHQNINLNFGNGINDVNGFVSNIQSQLGNLLNGMNINQDVGASFQTNDFDDSDEDSQDQDLMDEYAEEEKYYEEEEPNEEEEVTNAERINIINAISSYAYEEKGEEEN
jgi:hypothetical protein